MRKVKIINHGNTWIDTTTPIVCPECASLNVKKDTFQDSRWHGPFKIKNISQQFYCKDCHCRFSTDKEKRHIVDVCWDEIYGYIALIALVLFLIILAVVVFLYHDSDTLPPLMTAMILISFGICVISFFIWLALQ